MKAPSDRESRLFADFYGIVAQIPSGLVTTYGRIAEMAGHPGASRAVGWAMQACPGHLPAHRVVNSQGRIAPSWPEQRQRLEAEGVAFRPNGNVDLRRHLW